jgi:hypothetical protein
LKKEKRMIDFEKIERDIIGLELNFDKQIADNCLIIFHYPEYIGLMNKLAWLVHEKKYQSALPHMVKACTDIRNEHYTGTLIYCCSSLSCKEHFFDFVKLFAGTSFEASFEAWKIIKLKKNIDIEKIEQAFDYLKKAGNRIPNDRKAYYHYLIKLYLGIIKQIQHPNRKLHGYK